MAEIDAVSVCTPNDMHAPIAIAALKAGKHVMLEKPMTLSAELARQIIAARDASGKQLQMGMVWRQKPQARLLKEIIENGRLAGFGKHEELYANNEEYRKMVDLQKLEEEGGGTDA